MFVCVVKEIVFKYVGLCSMFHLQGEPTQSYILASSFLKVARMWMVDHISLAWIHLYIVLAVYNQSLIFHFSCENKVFDTSFGSGKCACIAIWMCNGCVCVCELDVSITSGEWKINRLKEATEMLLAAFIRTCKESHQNMQGESNFNLPMSKFIVAFTRPHLSTFKQWD